MGLRGRGRSRRMRVLRALAWLIVIPVTLGVVVVLPFRWIDPPTSAFILRDPLPAQQHAARHWVRLEQMSWTLPMAVVSAEDQKFPHHHGFDFEAISNALSEDRSRLRGASTLTQQLAKNLYLWPGRSLLRKALEAGFTLLMELLWSKRRILEIYLNVVEFGEGVYGVGAACRRMFHTDPGGVNLTQASLLAAVLPNPRQRSAARPSAGVRRRAAAIRRGVRNLGGAAYLPWLAPPPRPAPRPSVASKASRPSGTDRLGIAFALSAATGLGLAIAVSRLAYEGGTNGLTVATCRSVVMVAGLTVFCVLSGRRLRLPARDHLHCLGLGVLMAFMFYGNVGSVQFIPVGLAALLFYTYPPAVAVIQILVVRDPVPAPKLALIALAFAGLAIMLSTSLVDSSPVGVALALGAGVCAAWNSVWVIRKLSHHDALVLTLHMACVAAVILICSSAGSGRLHPPHTSTGWLGLVLVVALQSLSIPLFFLALRRVGALQSAMVSNIQPVVSIAAAFVLYAEVLTPSQFLGGGMVLGAVWFMQRLDPRSRN